MKLPKMLIYFGLFIGFLILFSLYGFWQATHPPKYITNLNPKDLGWEFEEVSLTTTDGIKLAAWMVPAIDKSDKVVILLHGYLPPNILEQYQRKVTEFLSKNL